MVKGWKKLTRKEIKRLKEMGCFHSTAAMERTFAKQKTMREFSPDSEPCWECRTIAKKLGYPI